MNDRSYYHNALESALLDGAVLEERINARISNLPKRKDAHIRLPKRLIIALVAAAILMISSVAVAVAVTRNQAFKEQTKSLKRCFFFSSVGGEEFFGSGPLSLEPEPERGRAADSFAEGADDIGFCGFALP